MNVPDNPVQVYSFRWLALGLAGFAALVSVGVAGYMILEGWPFEDALYMVVITLTTIGYGEVRPLSSLGRAFTIGFVLTSVSFFFGFIGIASQAILQGTVEGVFQRRRMEKAIAKLNRHYIICGHGRIGSLVCRQLKKKGIPFVVIEHQRELFEEVTRLGYITLQGDATNDDVLRAAGISRAKGVVCAVSSDADNVFITLSVRGLRPDITILARAFEERSIAKLIHAGATKVVAPYQIGGIAMVQAILKPHVAEFIEFGTHEEDIDFTIEEVFIAKGGPFDDVSIKDSNIRAEFNIIIVAIKPPTGRMTFNPSQHDVIKGGQRVIVVGHPDQVLALKERACPPGTGPVMTERLEIPLIQSEGD